MCLLSKIKLSTSRVSMIHTDKGGKVKVNRIVKKYSTFSPRNYVKEMQLDCHFHTLFCTGTKENKNLKSFT